MKKFTILAITLAALSSCYHSDTQLKTTISDADSVAINYFSGDGKPDTVTAVKIIHDKITMEQLAGFASASVTGIKANCGYDGSIHFYKNDNVVQDIKFRMNDEHCMQFTFTENGNMVATKLSQQAKELLQSINK
jgi:hypothetical protein